MKKRYKITLGAATLSFILATGAQQTRAVQLPYSVTQTHKNGSLFRETAITHTDAFIAVPDDLKADIFRILESKDYDAWSTLLKTHDLPNDFYKFLNKEKFMELADVFQEDAHERMNEIAHAFTQREHPHLFSYMSNDEKEDLFEIK